MGGVGWATTGNGIPLTFSADAAAAGICIPVPVTSVNPLSANVRFFERPKVPQNSQMPKLKDFSYKLMLILVSMDSDIQ